MVGGGERPPRHAYRSGHHVGDRLFGLSLIHHRLPRGPGRWIYRARANARHGEPLASRVAPWLTMPMMMRSPPHEQETAESETRAKPRPRPETRQAARPAW